MEIGIIPKMAPSAKIATPAFPTANANNKSTSAILKDHHSNEVFVAVVAPLGAGAGTTAKALKSLFNGAGNNVETHIIKASDLIYEASGRPDHVTLGAKTLGNRIAFQDLGDKLREISNDAIAKLFIKKVREIRKLASKNRNGSPDGIPRYYILDSIRHPSETTLLRQVYRDSFALVGVVCHPNIRLERLKKTYIDFSDSNGITMGMVEGVAERDSRSNLDHGQHVTKAFQEADFFVDNSTQVESAAANPMNSKLSEFIELLTSSKIHRPTIEETAMHYAYSAQLRSSCMSRQVGAAIIDDAGNLISTGVNEVPQWGGGVYGQRHIHDIPEGRCIFQDSAHCSNNKHQNLIVEDLVTRISKITGSISRQALENAISGSKISSLLEFSRAVHAEMDAIISAGRKMSSTVGARMFVTTFPCHYCARHIVSAGIHEVHYIEPYPKSLALELHKDAITLGNESNKVRFIPFLGVAPRMYARVYCKDRDYKDKDGNKLAIMNSAHGGPMTSFKVSYTDLEKAALGDL